MGVKLHCLRVFCLQYAPYLDQVNMKDWMMDNIKLGLSIAQIMAKHEQHYFKKDPIK